MHLLPSETRSDGDGKTRSQIGSSQPIIEDSKQYYKRIIGQANTVPLPIIFAHYGYRLDNKNKLHCPFHGNGKENTPSFQYYPDTASFFCFGCKASSRSVDFVSRKEGCSVSRAAHLILEGFSSEISLDDIDLPITQNYSERLSIMIDFANFIRGRLELNKGNIEMVEHIERIAFSFDKMNERHTLDNNALLLLVEELKNK